MASGLHLLRSAVVGPSRHTGFLREVCNQVLVFCVASTYPLSHVPILNELLFKDCPPNPLEKILLVIPFFKDDDFIMPIIKSKISIFMYS